jgi:hypothetical protein
MKATFVELPPFEKYRQDYLDDEGFRDLQMLLMSEPKTGDVIRGTGGLRKIRYMDARRGKGKRGGLRVIYYWWLKGQQFWLFTLYDKDEADDLTPLQCSQLKLLLDREISERNK